MGNKQGPNDNNRGQDTKAVKRVESAKQEKKRRPVWTAIKITAFALGSVVVLGAAGGAGYIASMLKGLPQVSAATFANNRAATVVYDRTGKVIGSFKGDGDRQPISSTKQVSTNLVNAFVAAEDKTFYTNIGVNPLAMGRAVIQDIIHHRIESGASTITQQTVKLAVFPDQQRTTQRKVQEIALAIRVNHQLTKNEIMTDYMNWVYMGRMGTDTVYGVKRASEILFHKDPRNLTLAESTFLAAIPNNPSYFSPYQYPKHTIQRQHYILDQMLANKIITQKQHDDAIKYPIVKDIHKAPAAGLPDHPYLMLDEIKPRVVAALVQAHVYDNATDAETALPSAGLRIYTTIDLAKQQDVENVLKNPKFFQGTNKTYPLNGKKTVTDLYEAGVTIVDNQTGGIVAVGGGRDYSKDSYDHADLARQPGSSIKPLLDYGPAIDQNVITAATPLYDAPTQFPVSGPQQEWYPKNDEGNFAGLISAREALYESRNVPAIDVLQGETPQVGFSYLNKMGMGPTATTLFGNPTVIKNDVFNPSAAIGGFNNGTTVEQMTSAYSTFANQGVWHQSYMISKIVDATGQSVYTAHPTSTQVFSPATAYIITDMLHDVLYHVNGTAQAVGYQFPGQYISGKTGTTDARSDGWFIGYTQKYTTGIWMGYNHHQAIDQWAYNLKFNVWNDIMTPILKADPARTPWTRPASVTNVSVSSLSGSLPTALSTVHGTIESEPFAVGTEPTQRDNVNVVAKYVVIGGTKYLATTNTPPQEVQTGVFIKLPSILDLAHKIPGGLTLQSAYMLPTQADPRGGQILDGGTVTGSTPNSGQTLSAPTGVSAQVEGSAVHIQWSPVSGAVAYQIFRGNSAHGPFVNLGNTIKTTFTDEGVPSSAGTVYYVIYAQSKNALSSGSAPYGVRLGTSTQPPGGNTTGNATGGGTGNGTAPESGGGGVENSTGPGNATGGKGSGGSGGTGNKSANGSGGSGENNTTNRVKSSWTPGFGSTNDRST